MVRVNVIPVCNLQYLCGGRIGQGNPAAALRLILLVNGSFFCLKNPNHLYSPFLSRFLANYHLPVQTSTCTVSEIRYAAGFPETAVQVSAFVCHPRLWNTQDHCPFMPPPFFWFFSSASIIVSDRSFVKQIVSLPASASLRFTGRIFLSGHMWQTPEYSPDSSCLSALFYISTNFPQILTDFLRFYKLYSFLFCVTVNGAKYRLEDKRRLGIFPNI